MDRIRIVGGQRLNGTIPISGAKNATLPLMIASLLTDETLILENVPRLADVVLLQRILGNHGVDMMIAGKRAGADPNSGRTIHLSAKQIVDTTAPYDMVSQHARELLGGRAAACPHGRGESVAARRLRDRHPSGRLCSSWRWRSSAPTSRSRAATSLAQAKRGLRGGKIEFPKVTVGGTHVALMAAAMARGTTEIENAAREPEVGDVADCLNKMGAKISGAGTSRIVIEGVREAARRARTACCPTASRPAPTRWRWR